GGLGGQCVRSVTPAAGSAALCMPRRRGQYARSMTPAPGDASAMERALVLAREAAAAGEIPVGAVVLDVDGSIIGEGRNRREVDADPSAHAEIVAMREAAAAIGSWNLAGRTLVVTLEPCLMCAGALLQAHIGRVV